MNERTKRGHDQMTNLDTLAVEQLAAYRAARLEELEALENTIDELEATA